MSSHVGYKNIEKDFLFDWFKGVREKKSYYF